MFVRNLAARPLVVALCGAIPGLLAAGGAGWWLACALAAMFFLAFKERCAAAVICGSFLIFFGRSAAENLPNASGVERFIGVGQGELLGHVASEGRVSGNRFVCDAEAAQFTPVDGLLQAAEGRVRVRLALGDRPPPEPGDRVRVRGVLQAPRVLRDAADPGAEMGLTSGTRAGIQTKSPLAWSVESSPAAQDYSPGGIALRVRAAFLRGIGDSFGARKAEANLVSGIVLGRRDRLDPITYEDFRVCGATHILAASGANIAMLAGPLLWLLPRLRLRLKSASLLLLTVLFIYTLASGASPSIVRAFLIAVIWIGGRLLGRDSDMPSSIGAAALLMLFVSPAVLWDIGAQLSFVVVSGLVAFSPILKPPRASNPELKTPWSAFHGVKRLGYSAIAGSVVAWLVATPILAQQFGTFPLYGFIANVLIAGAVAILLPVGLAAGLLGALGWTWLSGLLAWPLVFLAGFVAGVASFFSRLPYASVAVGPPGWTAVLLAYAAFGLVAWKVQKITSLSIEEGMP